MPKQCFHAIVSGRVQGVFYRQTACKQAKNLQLTGWIKNLANGDVELIACGEEENLLKFRKWVTIGPPAAKVKTVSFDDQEWQEFTDFAVRR